MKSVLLHIMKNALTLHSSTGVSVCAQLSYGNDSKPDELLLSGGAITMHGLLVGRQHAKVTLLEGQPINYEFDSILRNAYAGYSFKTLEMPATNDQQWGISA
jgi:hypothetical protein